MRLVTILAAALLLSSCERQENVDDKSPNATSPLPPSSSAAGTSAPDTKDVPAMRWTLQQNDARLELALGTSNQAIIRFFCATGKKELTVNVSEFQPIGSEERLSVGTGNFVATLVADTRGDPNLGGVSGVGAVPESLETLFNGNVSASYGSQESGPHPAPPKNLSRKFVAACKLDIAAIKTTVFS